ncbi:hypothetical protein A3B18_02985 [Candidatus Giovannonibacteria bacterium RIFCSPLOWO2_01_FULL_46_13]|uniref:Uncharacterized protein n=1 Tax=Candidatus Giovannonibacteria bacterium RIFCSPLOWO2_01_FULL_46_13 TaxID=1798352 RepID=A0A1F5X3X1_9BACT|nr:MAG: hypothetical protein A3B18_02985 [Candidatus Giovannonibacteria bacterium RIFCSPLOWO2_01_FULL_46_13]
MGIGEGVGVGVGVVVAIVMLIVEVALPPEPIQTSVYEVVVETVTDCAPFVDSDPVHPPEAVQDVAYCVCQLRVDEPPWVTLCGFAVKVMIGCSVCARIGVIGRRIPNRAAART